MIHTISSLEDLAKSESKFTFEHKPLRLICARRIRVDLGKGLSFPHWEQRDQSWLRQEQPGVGGQ